MGSPSHAAEHDRTIPLAGELDLATRIALQERFEDAARSARIVTVDLCEVTYMDSSAIGALIALHRQVKERGGEVRLRLRTNAAYRLLEIAGLIHVFPLEIVSP